MTTEPRPRLTADQQRLVLSVLPLTVKLARRYAAAWRLSHQTDDVIAEALAGVCRASQTYDPEKSSFGTYAGWWIKSAVNGYVKREGRTDMHTQALPPDDSELLARCDPERAEEWPPPRWAARLARLPERERSVVLARTAGRTLEDIGRDMGISKERVRQLSEKAYAKLRRILEEEDGGE